ncbi:MAG: tetratricopeptide repeat protein [Acidobacteria bacterium]|nr:tetratricopeptide repeat protein [Acidobacteriota bacterium]
MKSVKKILPFLFMAMIFAVPVYAQTGAIEGKVLDPVGEPMVGALISIDRQGISQHFEVKTDSKGSYFHAGLPTGQYKVSVMRDGKVVNSMEGVRVSFGGVAKADFDFQKLAAAGVDAAAAVAAEAERKAAEDVKNSFDGGIAAMQAKNFAEAARLFQEAADKDPTQHVIYGNLGGALSEARKYEEAAAAYRKAIELKPDEAAYYNNLGIVLGSSGKIDEAIAALQKSAELNPQGADKAYFNLGAVLTNRGRTAEAGKAFEKALEFNPNNAQAYYQLGISKFGNPATMADAIPILEKFLTMQPTGPDAEAAKQLIEAAKQSVPQSYKSDARIKAEKEAAEKAEKEKAEKAKKKKN